MDLHCVISGFCCEAEESCSLLGYYIANTGNNPEEHESLDLPPCLGDQ